MSMSDEQFVEWRKHCLDMFPKENRFAHWDDALESHLATLARASLRRGAS